jgi:hypothetical protein
MPHRSFLILSCLFGWTSLQAAPTVLEELPEASHHSELRIEKPVAVAIEQPFALVYNDNAKTKDFRKRDVYLIGSPQSDNPVIFNSEGSSKKMAYDSKTGGLIVSEPGYYEVIYSIFSVNDPNMFLTVNDKRVDATSVSTPYGSFTTSLFVLKLKKGDRVGLSVSGSGCLDRNEGAGNSASLAMIKL